MKDINSILEPFSLSGTTLKLIGLAAMTADHIGYVFFPSVLFLRMVGRLAWPIFAYMIAEGCRYTRHKCRYLGLVAGTAAICSVAEFLAQGSLYQSIMVTFTFSIVIIYALQALYDSVSIYLPGHFFEEDIKSLRAAADGSAVGARVGRLLFFAVLSACLVAAAFVLGNAPMFFPEKGFRIDYGFWGIMTPVFVWAGRNKGERLLLFAAGLFLTAHTMGGIQYYSLFALPLLLFYRGKRGGYSLKYFFYLYYPLHLAVIYGISWLCS